MGIYRWDYGREERANRARRTMLLAVWLVFEYVFAWRICIVWHVDVARPSTRKTVPAPNSFIKSERKRNAMKFLLLRIEKKEPKHIHRSEQRNADLLKFDLAKRKKKKKTKAEKLELNKYENCTNRIGR